MKDVGLLVHEPSSVNKFKLTPNPASPNAGGVVLTGTAAGGVAVIASHASIQFALIVTVPPNVSTMSWR